MNFQFSTLFLARLYMGEHSGILDCSIIFLGIQSVGQTYICEIVVTFHTLNRNNIYSFSFTWPWHQKHFWRFELLNVLFISLKMFQAIASVAALTTNHLLWFVFSLTWKTCNQKSKYFELEISRYSSFFTHFPTTGWSKDQFWVWGMSGVRESCKGQWGWKSR